MLIIKFKKQISVILIILLALFTFTSCGNKKQIQLMSDKIVELEKSKEELDSQIVEVKETNEKLNSELVEVKKIMIS